jgi:hypothetical protein
MPEEKAPTGRAKRTQDRDPTVLPQQPAVRASRSPAKEPPIVKDNTAEASLDAHLAWPVSGGDPDLRPNNARRSRRLPQEVTEEDFEALEALEETSSETIEHLATLTSVMRAATAATSAEADRLDARMSLVAAEVDRLAGEVEAMRSTLRRPRDRFKLRPDEIEAIAREVVARLQESFEVIDDR